MSELHSLYESRLEDLGNAKSVNKTRLKERLLEYFKEAQEQFDGRKTFLVFKEGMRNMIQDALKKRDFSEDALVLARAASIIRKDIFNHEGILLEGFLWSGKKLQTLQNQCSVHQPWHKKVTSTTNASRDFWMRHNLCFLGKREEVVLASLDGV